MTDGATNSIATATVTVTSGFHSGDTLAFNNGTNTETFADGAVVTALQTGDVPTHHQRTRCFRAAGRNGRRGRHADIHPRPADR